MITTEQRVSNREKFSSIPDVGGTVKSLLGCIRPYSREIKPFDIAFIFMLDSI